MCCCFVCVFLFVFVGVIGIFVNILFVFNYMIFIDFFRKKIVVVGKKSYIVVVGKFNFVKFVNFVEVEGWVVVGCWESGLIEDDVGYWWFVIIFFEMEVVLLSEGERIWGGEWWGGIERLRLDDSEKLIVGLNIVDVIVEVIYGLLEFYDDDVEGDEF